MNAQKELEVKLKGIGKGINDITILFVSHYESKIEEIVYQTKGEIDLSKLDFEYDEDHGYQELSGNVVFDDGSWLERDNNDETETNSGSEWWEYKKTPTKESLDSLYLSALEEKKAQAEKQAEKEIPKIPVLWGDMLQKAFEREVELMLDSEQKRGKVKARPPLTSLFQDLEKSKKGSENT